MYGKVLFSPVIFFIHDKSQFFKVLAFLRLFPLYGSEVICVLLSLAVNAGLAPQKISLIPYLIASWGTEEYRASSGPLK